MSYKPDVYVLADRGSFIFLHWFTYVVAGLYDFSHLPKPIRFHTNITESFQRETLELLKPDYEFIEDITGYNVIHHEGTKIIDNCNVDDKYYPFIREQILVKNNLEFKGTPFRRIYISRARSHLLKHHAGLKRRHMANEDILTDKLKHIGFDCIHLEDYNLRDKIRLFQEAAVIVSPNAGALTMCYFSHKNTTIINIHHKNTTDTMYMTICRVLSIPIYSYENIRCVDEQGNDTEPKFLGAFNMEINDYDDFSKFIETSVNTTLHKSQSKKYEMTLLEWQKTLKKREQIMYNCSEFDRLNDEWIPFSIGMCWDIINYNGPMDDIFIGPHEHQLLCAIRTGTDNTRRPSGINRRFILQTLEGNSIKNIDMPYLSYIRMLPHYKFIVSPEGNGIDCHRHYEALMAGCIPIVERNDRLFEKYGNCPILYTDDYSEINPEYLDTKYKEMLNKTWDFSRLCLDTFDADTQKQIKANGNYWGKRIGGREWYV